MTTNEHFTIRPLAPEHDHMYGLVHRCLGRLQPIVTMPNTSGDPSGDQLLLFIAQSALHDFMMLLPESHLLKPTHSTYRVINGNPYQVDTPRPLSIHYSFDDIMRHKVRYFTSNQTFAVYKKLFTIRSVPSSAASTRHQLIETYDMNKYTPKHFILELSSGELVYDIDYTDIVSKISGHLYTTYIAKVHSGAHIRSIRLISATFDPIVAVAKRATAVGKKITLISNREIYIEQSKNKT
jgi:hypothetical protein